jgi:pre-mRNA-splicing factor RBM22/SLT11
VKGECNRGATCPYRHVNPNDEHDPTLSQQNFKDRYYGVNDPVASKILGTRSQTIQDMVPPEDTTIKTLWLGGIKAPLDEKDIRDQLYSFGEITSVKLVPSSSCAFVTYTERKDAEAAARAIWHGFVIRGFPITVAWGKPQSLTAGENPNASLGFYSTLPPPGQVPPPGTITNSTPYYPSMDPAQFGSRAETNQRTTRSLTINPAP